MRPVARSYDDWDDSKVVPVIQFTLSVENMADSSVTTRSLVTRITTAPPPPPYFLLSLVTQTLHEDTAIKCTWFTFFSWKGGRGGGVVSYFRSDACWRRFLSLGVLKNALLCFEKNGSCSSSDLCHEIRPIIRRLLWSLVIWDLTLYRGPVRPESEFLEDISWADISACKALPPSNKASSRVFYMHLSSR